MPLLGEDDVRFALAFGRVEQLGDLAELGLDLSGFDWI
jgi:hypothetical protein